MVSSSSALAAGTKEMIMEAETLKSIDILRENAKIYHMDTEFDDVAASVEGGYALEITVPQTDAVLYQPVGRLDIDLVDIDEVEAALLRDDLTEETKLEIKERSKKAISENRPEQRMSVFSPTLLRSSNDDVEYYTYKGSKMMTERTYLINGGGKWQTVVEGARTKAVAQALFELAIMGVESAVPPLAVAANGLSALQMFLNIVNANTVVEHSEDYMQANINYDLTTQRTYTLLVSIWSLGLTTYKAYIIQTGINQKFYKVDGIITHGVEEEFFRSHNTTVKTLYYNDPWATAYEFIGSPLDLLIKVKVESLTFILGN